jgi:O-antigen ligase
MNEIDPFARAIERVPLRLRLSGAAGLAGLCLYALNVLGSIGGGNIGLLLMLIAFVSQTDRDWKRLRGDTFFITTVIYLIVLSSYLAWIVLIQALSPESAFSGAKRLLLLGFVPVFLVSYWISPDRHRVPMVLALALAGFLFRIAMESDKPGLPALLTGTQRATFGYAATSFATWAALAILGLLLFLPRIWKPAPTGNHRRWMLLVLWLAMMILFLTGLLLSQSRAAWIAAFLIIPLTFVTLLRAENRLGSGQRKRLAVTIVLVAALTLVLGKDILVGRLTQEEGTIAALLGGDLDRVPFTSIGYRVYLYRLFVEYWSIKPFFGWGPGFSPVIIQAYGNPELAEFVHFHNSYFDILIQTGLAGLSFLALLLFRLWRDLRAGLQRYPELIEALYLCAGGLALLALVSLTDATLITQRGIFVMGLLGGILHAAGGIGFGTGGRLNNLRDMTGKTAIAIEGQPSGAGRHEP